MPAAPSPEVCCRSDCPPASLWLLAVGLALLVRIAAMALLFNQLAADPDGYRGLAQNLVAHGVFGQGQVPSAYRPPLYPLLLVPCVALGDYSQQAIACLHVVLGTMTAAGVFWLGWQAGLGRWALLAAGLTACDPILLNQSTLVMTETLAALLVVGALIALGAAKGAGCKSAAAAGALLGLAVLCRPTFLVWLMVSAAALAWRLPSWRSRFVSCGALLAAAAIVLLPWVWRNQAQFGRPIVSTTHGGYTLLLGNNAGFYRYLREAPAGAVWDADEFDQEVLADRRRHPTADEATHDRREYSQALQNIARQPAMFAYASLVRIGRFWSLAPHNVAERPSTRHTWLRRGVGGWYLVEFLLAAAGMFRLRRQLAQSPWIWALLLVASLTAVHAVYWSDMRMRAPLMPCVAMLAAVGIAKPKAGAPV